MGRGGSAPSSFKSWKESPCEPRRSSSREEGSPPRAPSRGPSTCCAGSASPGAAMAAEGAGWAARSKLLLPRCPPPGFNPARDCGRRKPRARRTDGAELGRSGAGRRRGAGSPRGEGLRGGAWVRPGSTTQRPLVFPPNTGAMGKAEIFY